MRISDWSSDVCSSDLTGRPMPANVETIETVRNLGGEYKYGFVTDIESDILPKGLSEDTVRFISGKKGEPEWMLEWRLKAFRTWLKMEREKGEPGWAKISHPPIDFPEIGRAS